VLRSEENQPIVFSPPPQWKIMGYPFPARSKKLRKPMKDAALWGLKRSPSKSAARSESIRRLRRRERNEIVSIRNGFGESAGAGKRTVGEIFGVWI
jgi:hypothetical protein